MKRPYFFCGRGIMHHVKSVDKPISTKIDINELESWLQDGGIKNKKKR